MSILQDIPINTTCPALMNENYEYDFSGDCHKHCTCMLNNKLCVGVVIDDFEEASSRFVSRAKCAIDTDKIKRCPLYGSSKSLFVQLIKEKSQRELDEKLKIIGEYHVRDVQENQE